MSGNKLITAPPSPLSPDDARTAAEFGLGSFQSLLTPEQRQKFLHHQGLGHGDHDTSCVLLEQETGTEQERMYRSGLFRERAKVHYANSELILQGKEPLEIPAHLAVDLMSAKPPDPAQN